MQLIFFKEIKIACKNEVYHPTNKQFIKSKEKMSKKVFPVRHGSTEL